MRLAVKGSVSRELGIIFFKKLSERAHVALNQRSRHDFSARARQSAGMAIKRVLGDAVVPAEILDLGGGVGDVEQLCSLQEGQTRPLSDTDTSHFFHITEALRGS